MMLYLQGKILFVSTVRLKTVENMEVEINYLKWDVSNLALKCCKARESLNKNWKVICKCEDNYISVVKSTDLFNFGSLDY